jgi:DNA transformation protein
VADGAIFLKADDRTQLAFAAEGMQPFRYATRAGQRALKSYWRMPDRLYDEPDELAQWARQALEAARRSEARRRAVPRPDRQR